MSRFFSASFLLRTAPAVLFALTTLSVTSAHASEIGNTVTCANSLGSCSVASATVNSSSTPEFTITVTDLQSNSVAVTEDFTGSQLIVGFTVTGDTRGNLPVGFTLTNTDPGNPFITLTKDSGSLPSGYNGYSLSNGTITLNLSSTHITTGDQLTFDTSSAVAATPEPSSLMLLGTGALAGAGAIRRRLFAQRAR